MSSIPAAAGIRTCCGDGRLLSSRWYLRSLAAQLMNKNLIKIARKASLIAASGNSTLGSAGMVHGVESLLSGAPLARSMQFRCAGHTIRATQLHRYRACSAAGAARAGPSSREPRLTSCQAAWACASLGLLAPRPTTRKALRITTDVVARTPLPQRCAMAPQAGGCSSRTQCHTCVPRGTVRAAATSAQAEETVEGLTGLRKRVRGGYVRVPNGQQRHGGC